LESVLKRGFVRIPETKNLTLTAWNAADEHLIKIITENEPNTTNTAIFHDRFGYLSCFFADNNPDIVVYLKSQQTAISKNIFSNKRINDLNFITPFTLSVKKKWNTVILHIPKSLDLFELYLQMIHRFSEPGVIVYCAFLTRHFTTTMLKMAEFYFMDVKQSLTIKKSRVLTLTGKRDNIAEKNPVHSVYYEKTFKQYSGVFSKDKIDLATRFLLENIHLEKNEKKVLDWGCGNGIIGILLSENLPDTEVYYMDDNILATESVRMNTKKGKVFWEYDINTISGEKFDLIISNPPFHFEHENDISVSLDFFEKSVDYLSQNGRLIAVANKHINYLSHLKKVFPISEILAENNKFVIYQCLNKPAE
jgi:23S rRNA (guanine1835-N2)-methyltransferase